MPLGPLTIFVALASQPPSPHPFLKLDNSGKSPTPKVLLTYNPYYFSLTQTQTYSNLSHSNTTSFKTLTRQYRKVPHPSFYPLINNPPLLLSDTTQTYSNLPHFNTTSLTNLNHHKYLQLLTYSYLTSTNFHCLLVCPPVCLLDHSLAVCLSSYLLHCRSFPPFFLLLCLLVCPLVSYVPVV